MMHDSVKRLYKNSATSGRRLLFYMLLSVMLFAFSAIFLCNKPETNFMK